MFLFKTSGDTFDSVIEHQSHAYASKPRSWEEGELVLVSKNKGDLGAGEKQIQYVMRLRNIRELLPGEAGEYWPGNEGRWRYYFECYDTTEMTQPFNLDEVIGEKASGYHPVVTFKRLNLPDELTVINFLQRSDSLIAPPIPEEKELVTRELERLNAEFEDSPPQMRDRTSQSIERNARVVALLKRLHPVRCQVCQAEHFVKRNGERYSEIHHILPLAEGGVQATDNCLVLCPTCHRKMHYANVTVDIVNDWQIRIKINGDPFQVERNLLQASDGAEYTA